MQNLVEGVSRRILSGANTEKAEETEPLLTLRSPVRIRLVTPLVGKIAQALTNSGARRRPTRLLVAPHRPGERSTYLAKVGNLISIFYRGVPQRLSH